MGRPEGHDCQNLHGMGCWGRFVSCWIACEATRSPFPPPPPLPPPPIIPTSSLLSCLPSPEPQILPLPLPSPRHALASQPPALCPINTQGVPSCFCTLSWTRSKYHPKALLVGGALPAQKERSVAPREKTFNQSMRSTSTMVTSLYPLVLRELWRGR